MPGSRQSHLSKASRRRMTTLLAVARALAVLMFKLPPVARMIPAETSAASAIVMRAQFGSGTRDSNRLPGLLDHVACISRNTIGTAAEQHEQPARLRPFDVRGFVSEPVPEVAEDTLHVVVATRVPE